MAAHAGRHLLLALLTLAALGPMAAMSHAQTSTRGFTWSPAGVDVSANSRNTVFIEDTTEREPSVRHPTSQATPNPADTTATASLTLSRSPAEPPVTLNSDGTRRGTWSDVRTTINLTASTGTSLLIFFTRIDVQVTLGFGNMCTLTLSRQEFTATRSGSTITVSKQSLRYTSAGIGCPLGGIPANGTGTFSGNYTVSTPVPAPVITRV